MQLNQIVEFFCKNPSLLDGPGTTIRTVETHISIVLITERLVFKFKKAVKFPFVDQSQLGVRIHFCKQEVALNSRTSPSVYKGVSFVHRDPSGYVLNSREQGAIESCVVMRHLEDKFRLSECTDQALDDELLQRIALALSDFHRQATKLPATARNFEAYYRENLDTLANYSDLVPSSVLSQAQELFGRYRTACLARARKGRVVDGHGDLRLDHIYCFPDRIEIIDCVEFNAELRAVDPYEDLAFTLLGLRTSGDAGIAAAERLTNLYFERGPDPVGLALLPLYVTYRALVRCKVDCLQLAQCVERNQTAKVEYYRGRIRTYLMVLASIHDRKQEEPCIHVVAGLPATGKSKYADDLSRKMGLPVLSSDRVRKAMLGIAPAEVAGAGLYNGAYRSNTTRRTYRRLRAMIKFLTEIGINPIVDASFSLREQRRKLILLAERLKARIVFTVLDADEEIIRKRLEIRSRNPSVSDVRSFELWKEIQARIEPVSEDEFGSGFQIIRQRAAD
ncbi:MAG: AAA family ATPase [Leptospirales bacterium]|nr:AAA family ATPase [Leptospirales bacterium]